MCSNTSEMRLKKEVLQMELEYYTNLLAQHRKNEEKKIFNLPPTSSNSLVKRSLPTQSKLNQTIINKNNLVSDSPKRKNVTSFVDQPANTSLIAPNFQKISSKIICGKTLTSKSECPEFTENCQSKPDSFRASNRSSKVNHLKISCKPTTQKLVASKKLMGEIMALTEQLKKKSNTTVFSNKSLKPKNSLGAIKSSSKDRADPHLKNNVEMKVTKTFNNTKIDKFSLSSSEAVKKTAVGVENKAIPSFETKVNAQYTTLDKPTKYCSSPKKTSSKTHLMWLQKLNSAKDFLESTKNSFQAADKVTMHSLKNRANPNFTTNFAKSNLTVPSNKPKLTTVDFKNPAENSKYLGNKEFRFKKHFYPNNSLVQKSSKNKCFQTSKHNFLPSSIEIKQVSQCSKLIKTKYHVVNRAQPLRLPNKLEGDNVCSKVMSCNAVEKDNYNLVNNHSVNSMCSKPAKFSKLCAKKLFPRSCNLSHSPFKNLSYVSKKSQVKVFKKFSPHLNRSFGKKPRHSLNLNESYRLTKNLLENKSPKSSDIDVDLLVELAAEKENKLLKQVPKKQLYKSKNRLINTYSMQAKTAKMIKTKYFNPSKKFLISRNQFTNKNLKGYRNNYSTSLQKRSLSFPHKLKHRKCAQKKIVSLGGEKFIVGSTGRTLKKINNSSTKSEKTQFHKKIYKGKYAIKTQSPITKVIASRALNRSKNQVLSASMKKKDTYCKFYNRFGRCNKGIKCSYVHDPSKIAICTRFLRGTCKSDNCLFSHEINPGKMALCTFFLQDACTKRNCPYLHEKPSPNAELCKAFVQGYCPEGKDCKKAHVLICFKFLRGTCDKGKSCTFPHPERKEKPVNSKSSNDDPKKGDFSLETVLRYFESSPQEDLTRGLVVPRIKTLPEQPAFLSLTVNELS